MREVRWERMFPDDLESAFAACPVVYFAMISGILLRESIPQIFTTA